MTRQEVLDEHKHSEGDPIIKQRLRQLRMARARRALLEAGPAEITVAKVASGEFDDSYAAKVRRIGATHARIGLEPRWYIGGYALVTEALIHDILKVVWPRLGSGREEAARTLGSLVKAVFLDMDLAISVYLAESEKKRLAAEEAAQEAQRRAIGEERELVNTIFGNALEHLAARDLTYRVEQDVPSAYGKLREDFNGAARTMETTIGAINESIDSIQRGSQEIASASSDLAKRAESLASTIDNTIRDLSAITDISKAAGPDGAAGHPPMSDAANTTLAQTVSAMQRIQDSSRKISQIIGVMDEIAFQTNLLAINAGVEAARAGESGRGFAVVATEVRALAQRSAMAAKEIKTLISQSASEVEQGSRLVTVVQTAIKDFGGTMHDVDRFTQQNAATSEETTAACHSLAQQADQLAGEVQKFQTSGGRMKRAA